MSATPLPVATRRLLLVDDDPEIHDLVAEILHLQQVELCSASDGSQGIELALRIAPDLILLDYVLPDMNGLEVLLKLRAQGLPESIPVIFITGNECHKHLKECFRAGAVDYIRKPFLMPELQARVNSVLDRMSFLRQLERQALFDPLTDLCNRASIRARIQSAITKVPTCNYAVLYLDFDRFKLVNDCLGHDVGDLLLKQIADRLSSSLRNTDFVGYLSESSIAARLGGDEFVVLLEGINAPNDALMVANRLLKVLDSPYFLAGHRVCSSASIGVVNNTRSYTTPDEVLRDADTAMYEAKAAGKGRYIEFSAEMRSKAQQRLQIESDLRMAISNDELFLVYQPIIALDTGITVGFEALVRWMHPERGLTMPLELLPAAEESGLIVQIGAWVLDLACQEFSWWQRQFGADAPRNIHVNVSRKQLLPGLVDTVQAVLEKHSISPECLHLEITESEIMQDPRAAKEILAQLRRMGVKIDMDDFGTGYSSLAHLMDLPIDVLKIDRSFIANLERSRDFKSMVHAVLMLGQNLRMKIVAEGIESDGQLVILQSMDCDFGQGFLFGKPMGTDQVHTYLLKQQRSRLQPERADSEIVGIFAPAELVSVER